MDEGIHVLRTFITHLLVHEMHQKENIALEIAAKIASVNGPLFHQFSLQESELIFHDNPRADGAKHRARVLIPPGYLHPGKRKH